MVSQLDDLLAIAKPFTLDAECLKYRQIDIARGLAFANHMAAVIRESSTRDEHRDFTPVMRPPFLTNTVVSRSDGDGLIHQRPTRLDFRAGEFAVEVCQQ